MVLPRNLIGIECMDGIYELKSVKSLDLTVRNGVELQTLPFLIIIHLDLSGLKSIPAQVKAVEHRSRRS